MAYKTEYLVHPVTTERREAPIGFSWTTLFFGFFVPLIRGDYKWALIMGLLTFFTYGFSWIVFPFIYNSVFYKDCINKGFIPRTYARDL